jgi:hypothetical protein
MRTRLRAITQPAKLTPMPSGHLGPALIAGDAAGWR